MSKRNFLIVPSAIAFFIIVLLVFFGQPASAVSKIKVGYLIPLSGTAAAPIGQDMSKGTRLAVKHIMNQAGLNLWAGLK